MLEVTLERGWALGVSNISVILCIRFSADDATEGCQMCILYRILVSMLELKFYSCHYNSAA